MSTSGRKRTTRFKTAEDLNAISLPPNATNDEDGGNREFLGRRRSSTSTIARATGSSRGGSDYTSWGARELDADNREASNFQGGSDPLLVDKWKEDMGVIKINYSGILHCGGGGDVEQVTQTSMTILCVCD